MALSITSEADVIALVLATNNYASHIREPLMDTYVFRENSKGHHKLTRIDRF